MQKNLLVLLVLALSVATAGFAQASNLGSPLDPSSVRFTRCAWYARLLVEKNDWKTYADKIKAECPGVGFKCYTYKKNPGQNNCQPYYWDGKGSFLESTTYGP